MFTYIKMHQRRFKVLLWGIAIPLIAYYAYRNADTFCQSIWVFVSHIVILGIILNLDYVEKKESVLLLGLNIVVIAIILYLITPHMLYFKPGEYLIALGTPLISVTLKLWSRKDTKRNVTIAVMILLIIIMPYFKMESSTEKTMKRYLDLKYSNIQLVNLEMEFPTKNKACYVSVTIKYRDAYATTQYETHNFIYQDEKLRNYKAFEEG